jgi:hypothetical protein
MNNQSTLKLTEEALHYSGAILVYRVIRAGVLLTVYVTDEGIVTIQRQLSGSELQRIHEDN